MSKQTKTEKRKDRREDRRLRREAELRAARNRRLWIGGIITVAVLIVAGLATYLFETSATNAQPAPAAQASPTSSTANAAPTATTASTQGRPAVDNIVCNTTEQLTYHVHAHLSLYINGQPVAVPANIGIAYDQGCYYWLHTHDSSGIIHIEAPSQENFALGTFFKLWHEQFGQLQYPQQLDQTSGWTVYVNGKKFNGDFHTIALKSHLLITMAYNSPNITPDTVYNWGYL